MRSDSNSSRGAHFAGLVSSLVLLGLIGSVALAGEQPPRERLAEILGPILREPPVDGLLVFGVEPGSRSEKYGIQIGDVLTDYDGEPVASLAGLRNLFQRANAEKRKELLVLLQRDGEELAVAFGIEPLGLRLLPIRRGKGRELWRPTTNYAPDLGVIERCLARPDRWELVRDGDSVVGWSHCYLERQDGLPVLRVQTAIRAGGGYKKEDATIGFEIDRFLSVRWIRLAIQDKLILELGRDGDELRGARVGIPVGEAIPNDVVCEHLAGLVAATMADVPGSVLRCSYLPGLSHSAAPFADFACIGDAGGDSIGRTGERMTLYELRVFGESTARFWIDERRDIAAAVLADGRTFLHSTQAKVAQSFPDCQTLFEPIAPLPRLAEQPPGPQNR